MERELAQAKAARARNLKESYEGNAEVQRARTMTSEERARNAIDLMIPHAKERLRMKNGGREVSTDEARKYAENLAYRSDRDKK
jgi:hypothetical protein